MVGWRRISLRFCFSSRRSFRPEPLEAGRQKGFLPAMIVADSRVRGGAWFSRADPRGRDRNRVGAGVRMPITGAIDAGLPAGSPRRQPVNHSPPG